jgi:integrase/recombinase XerD
MRWHRNQPPKWREAERRGGQARPADGLDRLDPHGLAAWLDAYLESLAVRNFAAPTITGRRLALTAFLLWCQERDLLRPAELTRPIIESYQRWMHRHRKKNGHPLGFTTQRGRLVAIKDYFRWLCRQNVVLHNPASELEMPRNERRLPQGGLTVAEIERVLSLVDVSRPLGLRDRAMLEVFYSTGLRRLEVARLELGDVNPERGVVLVRQGKGKKDRVTPIGERALEWVNRYLVDGRPELLTDPRAQALFLSGYGDGPLHPDYLSRVVVEYLRRAGIAKGGCHLFRHSCATLMLEGGADIRFIQQMLGHANLNTTQIYTEVTIAQLRRVHSMTHPASK